MIDLDPLQDEAITRAMSIVRNGGAFKLLGKAGTGKTTTGLSIVESIEKAGYKVVCCAFTNKAVNRMREVGYPADKCRTVHRLLYKTAIMIEVDDYTFSEEDTDKILRFIPKDEKYNSTINDVTDIANIFSKANVPVEKRQNVLRLIKKGRGNRVSGYVLKTEEDLAKENITHKTVIVVDELSMLPLDMADELHGFFRSVIYIGDPGQLPPVRSVDTCQYLSCDDQIELKTLHRVAGNEHLLDLIYALDEGKIPPGIEAIRHSKFESMVEDGFQFISYTNDGVSWINENCRRFLERHNKNPVPGEPLITITRVQASRIIPVDESNRRWFLENEARLTAQHEASNGQSGAIYNWSTPIGVESLESVTVYRMLAKNSILRCAGDPVQIDDSDMHLLSVTNDDDPEQRVWSVRTLAFWRMTQGKKRAFRKIGKSMTLDFAYAITAHKAQGSEWPRVAVMLRQTYRRDIGNPEMLDEIKRWNYTAATRGKEDIQLFTSIIGCPYG